MSVVTRLTDANLGLDYEELRLDTTTVAWVGAGEALRTHLVDVLIEVEGWIYRGDAGDDGGHVLVLEDRPWHGVAHAHVVSLGGDQWRNYLRLRDLLRESPAARERYAAAKRSLLQASGNDRSAYTMGKTDIVRSLLASD